MAFPQVLSVTETSSSSNSGSHSVAIDPGNAGDLHVMIAARIGAAGINTPTGWTEPTNGSTTVNFGSAIKVIVDDGALSSPVTVTVGGTPTLAAQVYRIQAGTWSGDLSDVEIAAAITGTSDNPNPDSLSPSYGAADTLWLAVACGADDDATVASYPTNYTDGVDTVSGGGTNNGCEVATAVRENNTATEDPGGFVFSQSEFWHAYTIAIRPASGTSADATGAGIPKVVKKIITAKEALAGGLPEATVTKASFVTVEALAGCLPTEAEQTVSPSVSADSFLLLEDGSSYLLLEDGASKLLILEGVDAITINAICGAVPGVQRLVHIMPSATAAAVGLVDVALTAVQQFISIAATCGAVLTRHVKANLFNTQTGIENIGFAESTTTTASTSHVVNLPDGSDVAGNGVLIEVVTTGKPAFSWPGGYTKVFDSIDDPNDEPVVDISIGAAYRILDGTEGYSSTGQAISMVTGEACTAVFHAHLVRAPTGAVEVSDLALGTTASGVDPLEVFPSSGASFRYFAFVGYLNDTVTTDDYPDGYVNTTSTSSGLTDGPVLSSGDRYDNTNSEDPGEFTISDDTDWMTVTLSWAGVEPLNSANRAYAAAIPAITKRWIHSVVSVAAGIATKGALVVKKGFDVLAGAIPNAVADFFGSTVTLISVAAKAGGLPVVAKKTSRVFAVIGAGITTATETFLQFASAFIGGMGLGSVSRPGGGWVSWKTKSKR